MKGGYDDMTATGYAVNAFLIIAFSPFILLAILVSWIWDEI